MNAWAEIEKLHEAGGSAPWSNEGLADCLKPVFGQFSKADGAGCTAKELALAERLAIDLRRRGGDAAHSAESPALADLVDAMEMHISQQIDDHAKRMQSLSRHNMFAMNAIFEKMQKKLNLFMALCAVQVVSLLSLIVWAART